MPLLLPRPVIRPRPAKTSASTSAGAVDFINHAARTSSQQLAKIISEYIRDSFFGGDLGLLSSKDPTKTASFRALCERQDLLMGVSTLYRLVKIGQQVQHLPADLAEKLTMTHHRALLAVSDKPHKAKLARQAVKHGWTVGQLQQVIAAEQPPLPDRPGRPLKPALLKWLGAVKKANEGKGDPIGFAVEFLDLDQGEQLAVKADLLALQAELAEVLAAISG